jgi:4-hydroxy-tetrahydrodipicolinate reductase
MKLAIIGYGKMGRLIESLAVRDGWEIGPRLDIDDNRDGSGITAQSMRGVDAAVDFSQPDAVAANIRAACRARVNLVVGTTGWDRFRPEIRKTVLDSGIGLVYGSNFSVGVNLFFEIVERAAQLVGKFPQYDPFLSEDHHRAKKDAPSGTALTLLEIVKLHLEGRSIGVASTRAGHIPGNHRVGFDSEADTIVLEHQARSRQGFAEGALLAARWIVGKQGFYEFREVFGEIAGLSRSAER